MLGPCVQPLLHPADPVFPPPLANQLCCLESLRSASGKVWVRDEVGVGEGMLGIVSRQL